MSASSFQSEIAIVNRRSADCKPGVRKFAKTSMNRAARKRGKDSVVAQVGFELAARPLPMDPMELHLLDQDALEAYADHLLGLNAEAYNPYTEDDELLAQERNEEEQPEVPLHLQGALPDWMISALESARGNAFDMLSLFESKTPSPKAVISMEDEVMYA